MARPKAEIDISEVERLAGLGLTQAEIALHLGISDDTLQRRKKDSAVFAEAIKKGRVKAADEVGNKLYEQCMAGNVAAIIWYEKTRRGLSDKVVVRADDLDRIIESEIRELAGRGEEGAAATLEAEGVN